MTTTEQIKELGIVGAGGAGFPTYVQTGPAQQNIHRPMLPNANRSSTRIKSCCGSRARPFFKGLVTCLDMTAAKRCIIGIKAKYADLIAHLEEPTPRLTASRSWVYAISTRLG